eukprot:TRINITY_DN11956_c0_g8_i2.p1 TRINITY_DN11956_c0_g8~~TRINITY_DN11956_c0_g8_i2.p1  ORF type:complete len:204 (+),score=30.60 TRINITY_DN11956_c0_g8_i2:33-644(+)
MDITDFATYEDFLDSQVQPIDLYYLEDEELARQLVELGFRGTGEVIKRKDFEARKKEIEQEREAARTKEREEPHRTGKMMSILFLRAHNSKGQEVSGYIDLTHRFQHDDFDQYFSGARRLMPRPNDLSYYNWSTGTAQGGSSTNYQITTDENLSVAFKNRRDRKIVYSDPQRASAGDNSTRTVLKTDDYLQVVFYDHVTRITA